MGLQLPELLLWMASMAFCIDQFVIASPLQCGAQAVSLCMF